MEHHPSGQGKVTHTTLRREVVRGQFGDGDLQGRRGGRNALDAANHHILRLGEDTDDAHGDDGGSGKRVLEEPHGDCKGDERRSECCEAVECCGVRAVSNEELWEEDGPS